MKKSAVFLLFIGAVAFLGLALRPSAAAEMAGAENSAVEMPGIRMPFQNAMQASMSRGKQVYVQVCLACHMATAAGVEGMNPPLIKTKFVLGDKPALVKIVLNGMKGDIDIDGDTYHGVMAPHSELTDQQIADVLTYVRNSFGNKASVVTPTQVKTIRAGNKQAAK
jgi:mono/diheme cytochrome c family protein